MMKVTRSKQDDFIAQCRSNGLSVTHQRLAIFEAVMANCNRHPSAEVIYQTVRERYPTISFNTIYKNLETFEELGIVVKVNPLYNEARYDVDVRPHHHLICRHCKTIVDVHDKKLDALPAPEEAESGFQVENWTVQFTGLCADCLPVATG
ncbi:MAG TPA: Fur family transcriptional regulator [Gemmatimonadota bacterium]|nr:Fur family transcriptional regulator [Gemmatimonadota bacterium]